MRVRREVASAHLALPDRGTRASSPFPIHELLFVFFSLQLLGQVFSPAFVALDPYHEHLFIGRGPQVGLSTLGRHQHALLEPHSHPITGSVLELSARHRPQVISQVSSAATQISSYFGTLVSEIMAPGGSIPAIPLLLLLPLGLAAMLFTPGSGQAPPAPPPKPSAG